MSFVGWTEMLRLPALVNRSRSVSESGQRNTAQWCTKPFPVLGDSSCAPMESMEFGMQVETGKALLDVPLISTNWWSTGVGKCGAKKLIRLGSSYSSYLIHIDTVIAAPAHTWPYRTQSLSCNPPPSPSAGSFAASTTGAAPDEQSSVQLSSWKSNCVLTSLNILLDPAFLSSYKQLPLGSLAWVVPLIFWVLQVRSCISTPPCRLPSIQMSIPSAMQFGKCPALNSSRPAATELCTKSLTHGTCHNMARCWDLCGSLTYNDLCR